MTRSHQGGDSISDLSIEQIRGLRHSFIGNSWKRNDDGSWFLPKHTLGWQIAAWCSEYLLAKDGGPWTFTPEQLRLILWWYAVDGNGQFVYRRGVIQRLKGWGKDPLLAVVCLIELVGPSRFSHWQDGLAVGAPEKNAWINVAAVSQTQTQNTMTLFPSLISDRMRATYGIKEGATLIRANGGRQRLQAVTSNYRTLEGGRTTFTVLNETHHWVGGNGGHAMYEVVSDNLTKMGARFLAITNAYMPGEGSVAEKMRLAFEQQESGEAQRTRYMYDSIEANPLTPLTREALEIVLPIIRGDAVWLPIDDIIDSISSTDMEVARQRRMWLNQIVAEDDAIYGPAEIQAITRTGKKLNAGDEIVLGFDGSKAGDDTALIAIRVKDKTAFVLGHWSKPDGPRGENWTVPRAYVDATVRNAFATYTVRGFYADVNLWESYIHEWSAEFGETLAVRSHAKDGIGWDMRSHMERRTKAHERLVRMIFDKAITVDDDLALRRHLQNARRKYNQKGLWFGKASPDSPLKVDLYAALLLANEALNDYLTARGKKKRTTLRQGHFL